MFPSDVVGVIALYLPPWDLSRFLRISGEYFDQSDHVWLLVCRSMKLDPGNNPHGRVFARYGICRQPENELLRGAYWREWHIVSFPPPPYFSDGDRIFAYLVRLVRYTKEVPTYLSKDEVLRLACRAKDLNDFNVFHLCFPGIIRFPVRDFRECPHCVAVYQSVDPDEYKRLFRLHCSSFRRQVRPYGSIDDKFIRRICRDVSRIGLDFYTYERIGADLSHFYPLLTEDALITYLEHSIFELDIVLQVKKTSLEFPELLPFIRSFPSYDPDCVALSVYFLIYPEGEISKRNIEILRYVIWSGKVPEEAVIQYISAVYGVNQEDAVKIRDNPYLWFHANKIITCSIAQ